VDLDNFDIDMKPPDETPDKKRKEKATKPKESGELSVSIFTVIRGRQLLNFGTVHKWEYFNSLSPCKKKTSIYSPTQCSSNAWQSLIRYQIVFIECVNSWGQLDKGTDFHGWKRH
jgi:hypothetical protein